MSAVMDVRQVIAEESGHWVHLDEPEVVLAAIRWMVFSTCALAQYPLQPSTRFAISKP
jgi:hypothetical protein